MLIFTFFALVIFVVSTSAQGDELSCDAPWEMHDTMCFYVGEMVFSDIEIDDGSVDPEEAQIHAIPEACVELDDESSLASVVNEEDYNFVLSLLDKNGVSAAWIQEDVVGPEIPDDLSSQALPQPGSDDKLLCQYVYYPDIQNVCLGPDRPVHYVCSKSA